MLPVKDGVKDERPEVAVRLRAPAVQTAGITNKPSGIMALFSTHPPFEERIAALQARQAGQG